MNIADLNSEARALVDADTTSYTAADLLRRINAAYEEIVGYILGLDGLWQYDDTNYTDFPIGTTTLIEGQKDYTFDSAHLEIEGISVEDAGGIWHQLDPIDQSNFGQDPAEFQKNSGMPIYYDKSGRSFLLYPAPTASAVTLASGCKVYFKRTADVFTSAEVTTGTKQPGFASPYHIVLAYMAALPYALSYKKDRVAGIQMKILELKKGIKEHYGMREADRRKIMSMSRINFR